MLSILSRKSDVPVIGTLLRRRVLRTYRRCGRRGVSPPHGTGTKDHLLRHFCSPTSYAGTVNPSQVSGAGTADSRRAGARARRCHGRDGRHHAGPGWEAPDLFGRCGLFRLRCGTDEVVGDDRVVRPRASPSPSNEAYGFWDHTYRVRSIDLSEIGRLTASLLPAARRRVLTRTEARQ